MAGRDDEPGDQDEEPARDGLRAVLYEEVGRLPARYRVPVFLNDLEGKTCEEVAEMLRWPVASVEDLLSRGRERLRSRMRRRGFRLSTGFLVTALSHARALSESVPSELVRRTVLLAIRSVPRPVPPDSSASPQPKPAPEATSLDIGPMPRPSRWFLGSILVLVISSSLLIAAHWTIADCGRLSGLGSVFSSLFPPRGSSMSCH